METTRNDSIEEITEAIYARLVAQWEGWKNQDPAPNEAIIADDFHSIVFDGSRHAGRPPARKMSEEAISEYKLSEFRAVPIGTDAALVTYFADIKAPGNDAEFHMAVGESWAKQNGQWRIRGFSGTLMK
jgi:Domain of unknown function (DUF4440)